MASRSPRTRHRAAAISDLPVGIALVHEGRRRSWLSPSRRRVGAAAILPGQILACLHRFLPYALDEIAQRFRRRTIPMQHASSRAPLEREDECFSCMPPPEPPHCWASWRLARDARYAMRADTQRMMALTPKVL